MDGILKVLNLLHYFALPKTIKHQIDFKCQDLKLKKESYGIDSFFLQIFLEFQNYKAELKQVNTISLLIFTVKNSYETEDKISRILTGLKR